MSSHVVSWARKQTVGDPGTKLVLLILAENADDTGHSWWGQKRLAVEAEMGRSTVQKKLGRLRDLGLLEVDERKRDDGGRTANGYRLRPPASNRGGDATPGEAAPATPGEAAELSGEKSSPPPPQMQLVAEQPPPVRTPGPKLVAAVGGRVVTDDEYALALELLGAFNAKSGRDFRGKEWIASIVRRLRERPDMDRVGHLEVIDRVFARPWWKGDPTPSVVWGNGKVFDRAVQTENGSHPAAEFTKA